MSNIETPQISYRAARAGQVAGLVRMVVPAIALAVMWLSFEPFSGGKIIPEGSKLINQLGYSGLAIAVLGTMFLFVPRVQFSAAFSVSWIAMLAFVALSVANSPDPSAAQRAFIFVVFAFVIASNFAALPPHVEGFASILKWVSLVVLGLSYLGLLMNPAAAIHQGFEMESQHAGLWRGVFIHKNIAGPVMAAIGFGGVYLARRGQRVAGFLIAIAAFLFLANTGSKTSAGLAPMVLILILFPAWLGLRPMAALAALLVVFATQAITIGTVFVPAFDALLRAFDPYTTYTGRIEIWEFAKDHVAARPWTGFGFDGFWVSDFVKNTEQPFDRSWDPRGIIHGHNGYLDVALQMGLPAMMLTIWLTLLVPAIQYARVPRLRENALLADFFFMIIVFAALNASLESFFFRRVDPVWLTLLIALFGLRMVTKLPVRSS